MPSIPTRSRSNTTSTGIAKGKKKKRSVRQDERAESPVVPTTRSHPPPKRSGRTRTEAVAPKVTNSAVEYRTPLPSFLQVAQMVLRPESRNGIEVTNSHDAVLFWMLKSGAFGDNPLSTRAKRMYNAARGRSAELLGSDTTDARRVRWNADERLHCIVEMRTKKTRARVEKIVTIPDGSIIRLYKSGTDRMELMCTMVLVKQSFLEPELAVGSVQNPKKIFVKFDGSGERTMIDTLHQAIENGSWNKIGLQRLKCDPRHDDRYFDDRFEMYYSTQEEVRSNIRNLVL